MRTSSGGGFGPPAERDPRRVLNDVIEGYVTVESARDVYGVAIDPVMLVVLEKETAELRRQPT
jgi:N-methylhydantoinase B/oxoprolinase/acetone carboxylase alpha subunit